MHPSATLCWLGRPTMILDRRLLRCLPGTIEQARKRARGRPLHLAARRMFAAPDTRPATIPSYPGTMVAGSS
jgi:hypothetical protein